MLTANSIWNYFLKYEKVPVKLYIAVSWTSLIFRKTFPHGGNKVSMVCTYVSEKGENGRHGGHLNWMFNDAHLLWGLGTAVRVHIVISQHGVDVISQLCCYPRPVLRSHLVKHRTHVGVRTEIITF